MPERITNSYKPLFEVRLLHHYWLDDGATIFDRIAEQKRNKRLQEYDVRSFLAVNPTKRTDKGLSAFGCFFRDTALGFVVVAPQAVVIPEDAVFEFVVSVKNSNFFNYTSLTLRSQKVFVLYDNLGTDKAIYRYKENAPLLSNLTGAARGAGASKLLFLSREIPPISANDKVESLAQSNNALLQLTSDGPTAATQQLDSQVNNQPAYVHQGDVPAIVPPPDLEGAPSHGISLSPDMPDDVFALLSITAVRASDGAFSFVDGAGRPKDVPPVYQVRFKNRSTIWKYINKRTGAVVSTEAYPLPLTYFGNAGAKQKPSDGLVKAEKSSDGNKITRLISEIYV